MASWKGKSSSGGSERPGRGDQSGRGDQAGRGDQPQKGDAPQSQARKPSWRGNAEPKPVAGPKWREAPQRAAAQQEERETQKHWAKVASLTLLGMGLLGFFLWFILSGTPRTPVVVVAPGPYPFPFPPNAWSQEDVHAFRPLNQLTIDLHELPGAQNTKHLILKGLEDRLQKLRDDLDNYFFYRPKCLILYLSLHGAVDGAGLPCLVPPGASLTDSREWLPLADVLARLKILPANLPKLVILDASRLPAAWSLGQLYNGFTDGLGRAAQESEIQNLVILNSTSPGEAAWPSTELQGSIFGRSVLEGLSGNADERGNKNGWVSLPELHRYVYEQVGLWTQKHRNDQQRPWLILPPGDAKKFQVDLTWATRSGARGPERSEPWKAPVEESVLSEFWDARDRLQALPRLRQPDPWSLHDLEQKILWLEQLTQAGEGYRDLAQKAEAEIRSTLETMQAPPLLTRPAAHSLALGAREHWLDPPPPPTEESSGEPPPLNYLQRAEKAWKEFRELPRADRLPEVLKQVGSPEVGLEPGCIEIHFLNMLANYLEPSAWQHPNAVKEALACRQLADQAAVPADERVLHFIRPLVDSGDASRRAAEDRLFVGEPKALEEALGLWSKATQDYQQAVQLSEKLAVAFAVRDQSWRELPALALWLTRPLPESQNGDVYDTLVDLRLSPLIDQTRELAKLVEPRPGGEIKLAEVLSQTQSVAQELNLLRQEYERECNRLLAEASDDQQTWRDLADALAVPLMTSVQREPLRQKMLSIAQQLATRDDPTHSGRAASSAEPVAPDLAKVPRQLERAAERWKRHPLLSFLNSEEGALGGEIKLPETTAVARGEKLMRMTALQGQESRKRLLEIPQEVNRWLEQSRRALVDQDALTCREPASRADREIRQALAVWFPQPSLVPSAELLKLDRQFLFVGEAVRTMKDYWGPLSPEDSPRNAFYLLAGYDYLRSAEGLFSGEQISWSKQSRDVKSALDLHGLAWDGLAFKAIDPEAVLDRDQALVGHSFTIDLAPNLALPLGQAALFVREDQPQMKVATKSIPQVKDNVTIQRLASPVQVGPAGTHQAPPGLYRLADLDGQGPRFQAYYWYRGHVKRDPFNVIRSQGGIELDVPRLTYDAPRVTVTAQGQKRGSLIFVLDCSGSMNEVLKGEAAGQRRLSAAKEALGTMLKRLANTGDFDVGLFFFAHRVVYAVNEHVDPKRRTLKLDKGLPIVQTVDTYRLRTPEDVFPHNDVEEIIKLGPFGETEFAKARIELEDVRPTGVTPLYPSLKQALQVFRDVRGGSVRAVVAITDGKDLQWVPDELKSRFPTKVEKEDVIQASKQIGVPIHIVGFDIDTKEKGAAGVEYQQIAQKTGGSYEHVDNARGLAQKLEDLLGQAAFEVASNGLPVNDEPIPLQEPFSIPNFSTSRPNYEIRVLQGKTTPTLKASVDFVGGEALELILNRELQKLEFRRYGDGDTVFSNERLVSPDGKSEFVYGLHRPLWDGQSLLRFRMSLQNANPTLFSRHPSEVWAEITPLIPERGERRDTIVVYDLTWENKRPAPIFNAIVSNWPAEATEASFRIWCKHQATQPSVALTLEEALKKGRARDAFLNLEYEVKTQPPNTADGAVRVTVNLPAGQPDIYSAKPDIFPPADHISRRFIPDQKAAVHTFFYKDVQESQVRNYQLRFFRREDLHRDALELRPTTRSVPPKVSVVGG